MSVVFNVSGTVLTRELFALRHESLDESVAGSVYKEPGTPPGPKERIMEKIAEEEDAVEAVGAKDAVGFQDAGIGEMSGGRGKEVSPDVEGTEDTGCK